MTDQTTHIEGEPSPSGGVRPLTQVEVEEMLRAWGEKRERTSDSERLTLSPPFRGVAIGSLDFRGHVFSTPIDFSGAIFTGDAIFTEAEFTEYLTSFSDAQFAEGAAFSATKFLEFVTFGGAQFSKLATFDEAQFIKGVNFHNAQFTEEAYFDQAKFAERTYFTETHFNGGAIFDYAQLGGRIYFENAEFHGKVSFKLSVFQGVAYFIGNGKNSLLFAFDAEVLFRRIILREGVVSFEGVNLARCSFLGTNPQPFNFVGVQWASVAQSRKSRRGVRREITTEELYDAYRLMDWR